MTVGNLYYYFEDRRDLLAFCQETTLERLQDLATRVESAGAPAEEKLRALIAGHVFELNEGVPGSLAHLEVEAIDEDRRPGILARREAYEETWRRVIAAGVASRAFRRVDPGTAARALLGACNWTVKWYRPGGERDARQIGADFADVLVGGLVTRPWPMGARGVGGGARAGAKAASARSARKRGGR
jgi:AcrR family transcriptional regulator